jgi:hypothetical protein
MKKNWLAFAIATVAGLVVLAVAYLSSVSLLGAAWIIVGALLTVSIALIAILAGFVVVKSLFLIAAELSLLIFVAQSYCAAPARSPLSDDALRSLILLGLIYIIVAFIQSLYAAISERFEKIGKSTRVSRVPGWNIRKIIITTLFFIFSILFLVEIYLVIQPIIAGLCVYR